MVSVSRRPGVDHLPGRTGVELSYPGRPPGGVRRPLEKRKKKSVFITLVLPEGPLPRSQLLIPAAPRVSLKDRTVGIKKEKKKKFKSSCFQLGAILRPRAIWQCLETFGAVTSEGRLAASG